MKGGYNSLLLDGCREALGADHAVVSAVVFGSSARRCISGAGEGEKVSDIDLHVIARSGTWAHNYEWSRISGAGEVMVRVHRPASGGVVKWTVLYERGQLDVVVIPFPMALIARVGVAVGVIGWGQRLRAALNEMASCLHGGFFFIKGGSSWGKFYSKVHGMPGVRLVDEEVRNLANGFVCDYCWVLEKARRGELVAARHVLHARLLEVNMRIWREMRLRRGLPILGFGLGRKVEFLEDKLGVAAISVKSSATSVEIENAALQMLRGLHELISLAGVEWKLPPPLRSQLWP